MSTRCPRRTLPAVALALAAPALLATLALAPAARSRADDGDRAVRLVARKLEASEATGAVTVCGTAPAGCRRVRLFDETVAVTEPAFGTFEVAIRVPPGRHETDVVPLDDEGRAGAGGRLVVVRQEPRGRLAPRDGTVIDLRDFAQAPPTVPVFPEDARVGTWVEIRTTFAAMPKELRRRTAIVGRRGDRFLVEVEDGGLEGVIQGLVVSAKGDVESAWAARPNETPKKLRITPKPDDAGAATVEAREETVTVAAGTFRCAVHEMPVTGAGVVRLFIGKDADARDVLVKGGMPAYSLERLERATIDVGSTARPCRVARYDGGRATWLADEPLPFVGTCVRVEWGDLSTEIAGIGDDAVPRMEWPFVVVLAKR